MKLTVTEWGDIEVEVGSKINWMLFLYLFVKGCPTKAPWAIPWMFLVGPGLARQSCLAGWYASHAQSSKAGTWGRRASGWIRCDCTFAEHLVQAEKIQWKGNERIQSRIMGNLTGRKQCLRSCPCYKKQLLSPLQIMHWNTGIWSNLSWKCIAEDWTWIWHSLLRQQLFLQYKSCRWSEPKFYYPEVKKWEKERRLRMVLCMGTHKEKISWRVIKHLRNVILSRNRVSDMKL